MFRGLFWFFLCYFVIGMHIAYAARLQPVKDKDIVEDLNGVQSMVDNYKELLPLAVNVIRVMGPGECDGSDYGKTCPSERLLIAVCNCSGEGPHPDMALYRTEGMYSFQFVSWRPDVKKPVVGHGYKPVVFEAKAQKGGKNYSLTDIEYLISVTPWAAQIEEMK
jgi:hypothetical protein